MLHQKGKDVPVREISALSDTVIAKKWVIIVVLSVNASAVRIKKVFNHKNNVDLLEK